MASSSTARMMTAWVCKAPSCPFRLLRSHPSATSLAPSVGYTAAFAIAECLKDVQRFLREDDIKTRDAFFMLGRYKTARTDLVPLITTYAADTDTVYNARRQPHWPIPLPRTLLHSLLLHFLSSRSVLADAVKVVTFLTMPVEEESANHALQVGQPGGRHLHAATLGSHFMWAAPDVAGWKQEEVMLDIKDAFLTQDALAVVVALVGPPLMRHAERRMGDRDVLIVQLVITFLRNLIVIPDCSATSGAQGYFTSGIGCRPRLACRSLNLPPAGAQAPAAATGAQCAASSCSSCSRTARWSCCWSWLSTPHRHGIHMLSLWSRQACCSPCRQKPWALERVCISQGLLQGEAPLLLEIFVALFCDIPAKPLLDAAPAQPPAQWPVLPALPRPDPPQQKPPQRHPRFGGVFIHRLEGGTARCAVGRAQHPDLLGPVGASAKPSRPASVLAIALVRGCACACTVRHFRASTHVPLVLAGAAGQAHAAR